MLLFVGGESLEMLRSGLLAEDLLTAVGWRSLMVESRSSAFAVNALTETTASTGASAKESAGSLLGLLNSELFTLASLVVPEACSVTAAAIAGDSGGAAGVEADELASAAKPIDPSHLVCQLVSAVVCLSRMAALLLDVAVKLPCPDLPDGKSLEASEVVSASACPVTLHLSDGECMTVSSEVSELGC